jgi:hypothetical protein
LTGAFKYAILQAVRLGYAIAYLSVKRIDLLLQQLFDAFYLFPFNWHHRPSSFLRFFAKAFETTYFSSICGALMPMVSSNGIITSAQSAFACHSTLQYAGNSLSSKLRVYMGVKPILNRKT